MPSPNLVGIGNSQVPTNAMLGDLAYQDSVGDIDIEKIKARISDTATDIFVYDTSKDSDGGAWRHRTQNKSWYNEGASATRGARKEFPAVAVIVSINNGLMIYDGDDPNLPLWMEWTTTNGTYMLRGATNGRIAAMNGIIALSNASTYGGVIVIYFLSDTSRSYRQLNSNNGSEGHFLGNGIAARNDFSTNCYSNKSGGSIFPKLIDENTRDIAMTVLPNAPIDTATGLPRPTIAVATIGGSCIIRDDDEQITNYTTIATQNIDIHPAGFMIEGITGAVNDNFSLFDIGNTTRVTYYDARVGVGGYNTYLNQGSGDCLFEGKSNKIAIAQTLGLLRVEEEFSDYVSGLHNRTTSSYNTGWMQGDIKGAFLSSTDDTDITGSELITNGTFDSNVNNWVENTSTNTHSSGRMQITRSGGTGATAYQAFTTEVGKKYVATAEVNSSGSRGDLHVRDGTGWGGTGLLYVAGTASQTKILTGNFTATSTTSTIAFGVDNNNTSIFVDNVSVRIAEEDRSVNDNNLQVFGTVAKSAVATGAELVAYSGFNSSNYLFQPHNTDLEFGTGDYSVMLWYKGTSDSTGSREIFANLRGSSNHWVLSKEYTNKFVFDTVTDPNTYAEGVWNHVAGVRRSGIANLYVNGELVGSAAADDNINDTSDGLIIGQNPDNNDWRTRGSLALLRISGSAPTDEQIKKIYNDEKCLYHENVKCTLHGTSDNVTRLAFDDTNNVLHVGTSAGRSEFQGLNRINNTTTAVTTAISASNELVAEQ